jgi:hypothetical protein
VKSSIFWLVLMAATATARCPVDAQDQQPIRSAPPSQPNGTAERSTRYALIVIGIPGDEPHAKKFQQTASVWVRWLTEIAGVRDHNLIVLCGHDESDETPPATSEQLTKTINALAERLSPDDSLWVFLLGHGSQDQRHGWFHLSGPDMNAAQWAGLFAPLQCREQVFWLTQAGSGSFVKAMSLPGRTLIAATDADGEVNETRFPHLLADVMRQQLGMFAEAESTTVTSNVLEIFEATTKRVSEAFSADQIVLTEHAQLDDNGDGRGTELADLALESTGSSEVAELTGLDGARAARIVISFSTASGSGKPSTSSSAPTSPESSTESQAPTQPTASTQPPAPTQPQTP